MSSKKKILIVGSGISGLSAAWYIQQRKREYECQILEKTKHAGGHIQTETGDHLIELGPRIFKASKSRDFLQLIEEVDFSEELIFSSKEANKRYICIEGQLRSAFSLAFPLLAKAFLSEWRKPICQTEESILDFGLRRFGKKITEKILDPMMLGIYGGEIAELSVNACLPSLKALEQKHGSITKALLFHVFSRKKKKDGRLFSFQKGVGSFIRHLEEKLEYPILYGCEALSIEKKEGGYVVHTQQQSFAADNIVIALPAYEAAKLLRSLDLEVATNLDKIPYRSLTIVHVVIEGHVLKYPGFGYLVPSTEKEPLMGVVFDSAVFPQQQGSYDTKLTFMFKKGASCTEEEILYYLRKHLQIHSYPKKVQIKEIEGAIPQYVIGHQSNITSIQKNLPAGIHLIGNYLEGVSVSDAVKVARNCSCYF